MSTRGLWGFVIDGEEKLTYNHSDSYPDGLGSKLLGWLQEADLDDVRQQARELMMVSDSVPPTPDTQEALVAIGAHSGAVSTGQTQEWYSLLRNTQGNPGLTLRVGFMEDGRDFALNSLFCEWAYVIDLDAGMLEIYRGFQKQAHAAGRFAERENPADTHMIPPLYEGDPRPSKCVQCGAGKGVKTRCPQSYYPVAMVAAFSLDELPDEPLFLDRCGEDD